MLRTVSRLGLIVLTAIGAAFDAGAQVPQLPQNPLPVGSNQQGGANQQVPALPGQNLPLENQQIKPNYVLGPKDQIMIRAQDVDDLNEKLFRVEEDGTIIFPAPIGQIKVQGMTVTELESEMVKRLLVILRNPQVTILLIQTRADVVFLEGYFLRPGFYALEGKKTLLQMITSVGLQANASHRLKLTRRADQGPIPLPSAVDHPEAKVSTVEINMKVFRESLAPQEDILLAPNDTISVDRAERIYVQGAVGKQGPIELEERDSISMLQVLTLSGGYTENANPTKAYILRPVLDSARRAKVPIDLTKIIAAQTNDFPLMANDILYVPKTSTRLKTIGRVLLIVIPSTIGILYGLVLR